MRFIRGYLNVTIELGIIIYPDVADYTVTKGDITDMVFKAIDTPLMVQTAFGEKFEYKNSYSTPKTKYLGLR